MTADDLKRVRELYPDSHAGSDWMLMTDERKKSAGFAGLKAYQESQNIMAEEKHEDKNQFMLFEEE